MNVVISACLLGARCRYDGKSMPLAENVIEELKKYVTLIPLCAEIFAGLPTPRIPCERVDDRVLNRNGEDVTDAYRHGALEVLRLAKITDCRAAILKERSPSCGNGVIYDGSFRGTFRDGDGVTASLLKENGIPVYGESQIGLFLNRFMK